MCQMFLKWHVETAGMCKFNISGRGRSVSKREECEKCPVYDRKQSLRLKKPGKTRNCLQG